MPTVDIVRVFMVSVSELSLLSARTQLRRPALTLRSRFSSAQCTLTHLYMAHV